MAKLPASQKPLVHDDNSPNFPECSANKLERSWETLPPGSIFEVVVVDKCDREKELKVYVWKQSRSERQLSNIGCFGLRGIIRDYEIVKHGARRKRTFRSSPTARATA